MRTSLLSKLAGTLALTLTLSVASTVADAQEHAAGVDAALRLQWTDLRTGKHPAASLSSLWRDKLESSRRQWKAVPGQSTTLPVFSLWKTMGNVTVSILFNMVDCELPAGENLVAQCPLRVISGSPASPRIRTVDRACMLYVPPPSAPGQGPDPQSNYTTVSLDANRVMRLRVVQAGSHVPDCDLDLVVDAG